jgi:hypothetical protein
MRRDNLFDDLSVWTNKSLSSKDLQAFRSAHQEDDLSRWLMFYNNTLVLPFNADTTCKDCNPHVRMPLLAAHYAEACSG